MNIPLRVYTFFRLSEPLAVALRAAAAFLILGGTWLMIVDSSIIPDAFSPLFEYRSAFREVVLLLLASLFVLYLTHRMVKSYRGGDVSVPLSLLERDGGTEALRLTEEQWRLMVETLREHAIFRLDGEGNIESWNERAEKITRYREEEILGRSYDILFTKIVGVNKAAEDASDYSRDELVGMSMSDLQVGDDQRRLQAGVPPSSGGLVAAAGSWQLRRKDGSMFRSEISAQPVLVNNEPSELILARSVTASSRPQG